MKVNSCLYMLDFNYIKNILENEVLGPRLLLALSHAVHIPERHRAQTGWINLFSSLPFSKGSESSKSKDQDAI